MSNFRKRYVEKPLPGTRRSTQTGQEITSIGNPSLDKILGGGLPIGAICLIEEDKFKTHSKVLAKYFLAEGVPWEHSLFLGSLDDQPEELLRKLPRPLDEQEIEKENAESEGGGDDQTKNGLRIAWRYENLPLVNSEQATAKIGHHFNLMEHMNPTLLNYIETVTWSEQKLKNISLNDEEEEQHKNEEAEGEGEGDGDSNGNRNGDGDNLNNFDLVTPKQVEEKNEDEDEEEEQKQRDETENTVEDEEEQQKENNTNEQLNITPTTTTVTTTTTTNDDDNSDDNLNLQNESSPLSSELTKSDSIENVLTDAQNAQNIIDNSTTSSEIDIAKSDETTTTTATTTSSEESTTAIGKVNSPIKPKIFHNYKFQQLWLKMDTLLKQSKFHDGVLMKSLSLCRVCLTSFGSPLWYDDEFGADLMKFLTILRATVRSQTSVCMITMPMHLIAQYDETLVPKIRNLVDYAIELDSFAGTSRETHTAFKEYNGLLHIHKMTAINTLTAYMPETCDLAFKLRRKKFVIEKLHLPPELQEPNDEQNPSTGIIPTLSCSSSSANPKASLDF